MADSAVVSITDRTHHVFFPFKSRDLPAPENSGNAGISIALPSRRCRSSHSASSRYRSIARPSRLLPASAGEGTPVKQLRGFDKVELEAGESKEIEFPLVRRDISIWDVVQQEWSVPEGEFAVHVGFSSRDVQLKGSFTV